MLWICWGDSLPGLVTLWVAPMIPSRESTGGFPEFWTLKTWSNLHALESSMSVKILVCNITNAPSPRITGSGVDDSGCS